MAENDMVDEKDRIDGLVEVIKIARASFDQRRSYEWKFSLSLWTALVLFIGAALQTKFESRFECGSNAILVFLAVFIVVIQGFFEIKIYKANSIDLRRAELFEAHLDKELGVECYDERIKEKQEKANEAVTKCFFKPIKNCFKEGKWSVYVHCGLTMILFFLAGLLLF